MKSAATSQMARDYIFCKRMGQSMSEGSATFVWMRASKTRADEANLIRLAQKYADEDNARELLESFRWPNVPVCPHCKNAGDKPNFKLEAKTGSKRGVRRGVHFCGACRQQFTVTVERSLKVRTLRFQNG